MAVGFASYEIARSGLTYNERGLDVTGHNISNVNTLGYSRQQAIAQNSFYVSSNAKYGYGQVGTGVDIQQTRQIRHKFLDNIYRYENAKKDYWQTRSDTFDEVEGVMGEPLNAGIQSLLNDYWDAWQELSKDPSSLTTRALVRQLGESMAFDLNNLDSHFDQMQMELDQEFVDDISTLNALCERVAALNGQIKSVQIAGEAPNDYMDERNMYLDQISSLIDCEIYERDDGMQDVISNGVYLVYRDTSKELLTQLTPESGMFHKAFVVMNNDNPPRLQEMKFGQCKIQGTLEARGVTAELPDVGATEGSFNPLDPLTTTKTADVLYGRSSITNGSPNTMADIVVAIDISGSNAANLERIKLNIDSYVDGLYKKGLDFNLKLMTYGATAKLEGEYTQETANDFIAKVLSLSADSTVTANNFGGPGGLLSGLVRLDGGASGQAKSYFRENASRYTVLFTSEGIDGDGVMTPQAGAAGSQSVEQYVSRLNAIGMSLSVVSPNETHSGGDGSADAPIGWSAITDAVGGASIDSNVVVGNEWVTRDFADIMEDANDFVNTSVNDRISRIDTSMQIIPDVRKRVNALINIICRSINELHRSGKTLEQPPQDGEDFFVPINDKYPLEIGNIKINPKFLEANGLNYIVASQSGGAEDNIVARDIANLRNAPQVISNTVGKTTFDDYYRDAVYSITNQAADTDNYLSNQITVASQLDQMRHSIMDVSMDEEMSYMMKFKFGYDAAARVLNIIDSMIDAIVNRMGLVGR